MDLFDVVKSCFRRWYVIAPLLLVTVWFAHSAYSSAKTVYYSNAVIGIAPPSLRIDNVPAGQAIPRNGLLDIGGAPLVANMTALGLSEPTVVEQVIRGGGQPDFVARMFPVPPTMPQLPLIMIETTQSTPADATTTLELVIAQADNTMTALQRQAQVPDDQMVNPFVVSPPSAPAPGIPSRTRSTIAVFAAGAGLSVLVTVVIDVLLQRRKSRKQNRRPAGADPAAQLEPTPPRDNHETAGLSAATGEKAGQA